MRDKVVDFVNELAHKTELSVQAIVSWLSISRSRLYDWRERYGQANEHNGKLSRDHWLLPQERQAILHFHALYPLEGYRRLCFMMLDRDLVAVSPASVYRVLSQAGRLDRWNRKPSKKGTGFVQPLVPHEHWHVDITHLNIAGTFYYLCLVLDGASRFLVHFDLREQMTELDVECILQRAVELYPQARPRIISDNGPQFIAKDFKEFIRQTGMTHVRTSPYYPQSNGKVERFNRTYKEDGFRPAAPDDVAQVRRITKKYIQHYNEVRLHSALGYITPKDALEGRAQQIGTARDRKLEAARQLRAQRRQEARAMSPSEVFCA